MKKKKKDHEVYRDVLVCRLRCGRNMSFTGSTVHIYVITSADTDPRGNWVYRATCQCFRLRSLPAASRFAARYTRIFAFHVLHHISPVNVKADSMPRSLGATFSRWLI